MGIFIKIFVLLLGVLIALNSHLLDYVWHDKRTKKFRIGKRALIALSILFLLGSLFSIYYDEQEKITDIIQAKKEKEDELKKQEIFYKNQIYFLEKINNLAYKTIEKTDSIIRQIENVNDQVNLNIINLNKTTQSLKYPMEDKFSLNLKFTVIDMELSNEIFNVYSKSYPYRNRDSINIIYNIRQDEYYSGSRIHEFIMCNMQNISMNLNFNSDDFNKHISLTQNFLNPGDYNIDLDKERLREYGIDLVIFSTGQFEFTIRGFPLRKSLSSGITTAYDLIGLRNEFNFIFLPGKCDDFSFSFTTGKITLDYLELLYDNRYLFILFDPIFRNDFGYNYWEFKKVEQEF